MTIKIETYVAQENLSELDDSQAEIITGGQTAKASGAAKAATDALQKQPDDRTTKNQTRQQLVQTPQQLFLILINRILLKEAEDRRRG